MELKFDREKNRQERLAFVRRYAEWVNEVPNEVWSSQQALIIESFLENARNYALTPSEYLWMHKTVRAASHGSPHEHGSG